MMYGGMVSIYEWVVIYMMYGGCVIWCVGVGG